MQAGAPLPGIPHLVAPAAGQCTRAYAASIQQCIVAAAAAASHGTPVDSALLGNMDLVQYGQALQVLALMGVWAHMPHFFGVVGALAPLGPLGRLYVVYDRKAKSTGAPVDVVLPPPDTARVFT